MKLIPLMFSEKIFPAVKFLKSLFSNDKILLIMHTDADGFCSAAIIKQFLKENSISCKPLFLSRAYPDFVFELKKQINSFKANKVICVDISLNEACYNFLKEKKINCLVIDHHFLKFVPDFITLVNAVSFTKKIPSCAALCYKIAINSGLKKELLWVALIGSAADRMLSNSIKFLNCKKKANSMGLLKQDQLDLMFNDIVFLLSAAYSEEKFRKRLFDFLLKSITQENSLLFLEEKFFALNEIFNSLNQEQLNSFKALKKAKKIIDNNKKFYFVFLSSHFNLSKRFIASFLQLKFPFFVVLVAQKIKKDNAVFFDISIRSNTVNLVNLMTLIMSKLVFNGGGHKNAFGCQLPEQKLNEFITELKNSL